MNENTTTSFLENKKFLDYYKDHHLKSVSALFIESMNASDAEVYFKLSKNIQDKNERKKILKIMHRDYIKENKLGKIYNLILKFDLCDSKFLSHLIKNGDSEDILTLKKVAQIAPTGFKLTSKSPNLKIILGQLTKEKNIVIPSFFSNIKKDSYIEIDNKKISFEPVTSEPHLKKMASIYDCCWFSTKHAYPYKGFLNLTDDDNNLIGTIRYMGSTCGELSSMAGWINPKLTGQKYSEMSKSLLTKISLAMDHFMTKKDKDLTSEYVECIPHYKSKNPIDSLAITNISKLKKSSFKHKISI